MTTTTTKRKYCFNGFENQDNEQGLQLLEIEVNAWKHHKSIASTNSCV